MALHAATRSPPKKHHHHSHSHRDHHSGCRCTLLNILLGATIFVALNILFSYSYLKGSSVDTSEFVPAAPQGPQGSRVGAPAARAGDGAGAAVDSKIAASLPAYSVDDSEIFMGSVIERGSGEELHLTTFLLCHHMLTAAVQKTVHTSTLKGGRLNRTMDKLGSVLYKENGQRSDQPFHICKIKNAKYSKAYVVPGFFLPNRQNIDPNSNRRIDILRCAMKVQLPDSIIKELIENGESVQVEIYRGRDMLLRFDVPWRLRRAGYMLDSPAKASNWDAWNGYHLDANTSSGVGGAVATGAAHSVQAGKAAVYLCVPAIRRPPNRVSIGPLLEFVEHHLSIGVTHIFLGVAFSLDSPHMSALLQLFKSYIEEGSVSLVSEAGDGVDFASSFVGLRFSRGDTKTMFNTMCLYLSKGSATYAAFWDADELFVPGDGFRDIGELLSSAHAAEDTARSLTTSKKHPLCYLSVETRDYYPLFAVGVSSPWIGTRFAHEPVKAGSSPPRAIVPTRNIYSAGILTAGTCKMDPKWTSCKNEGLSDQFCVGMGDGSSMDVHNFDQKILADDVHALPLGLGVLHHYQTYLKARLSPSVASGNRYSKLFFPTVLEGLRRRGLEAMISLPAMDLDTPPVATIEWRDFTMARNVATDSSVSSTDMLGDFFDNNEENEVRESSASGRAAEINGSVELPEFANDLTELFLSSILEREFESPKLKLTVFLMNHAQLLRNAVTGVNVISVNRTMKPVWDAAMRGFVSAKYLPTGERAQTYYCRVALSSNSTQRLVSKGRFMPNRLTPDANANRKLDVLRCPLELTAEQFEQFHRSDEKLEVEILRDDNFLVKFRIPWKTRRTGYMLSSPPGGSGFDSWKGASRYSEKNKVVGRKDSAGSDQYGVVDNLYMCVPGMESPFDKRVLPLYAEFVEHHVQLGVDHMFIAATYDLHGANMKLLNGAFRTYIDDGLMTLSSQSGDNQDFRYGFKGLTFDRDNIKVMFVNMCLYMAKGSADYVGIWDFDEFFIPKLPHNSILDVIRAAEGPAPVTLPGRGEDIEKIMRTWKKGPGVADGDGHPFCYLIVNSETINSDGDIIDPDHPWIGNRFSHDTEITHLSFQKSILPTRKIFQAGLHIGGSCSLPFPWNGCSERELAETEFCYRSDKSVGVGALNKVTWINSTSFIDFMRFHAFDEGTSVDDAKRLDIDKDAIIYHIQAHRSHLVSKKEAINGPVNEYASRFFENVMDNLRRRGIALLQTLPRVHKKDLITASSYWEPILPSLDAAHKGPTGPKKIEISRGDQPPVGYDWTPKNDLLASPKVKTSLPSFSADGKDYVLGAIIERASDRKALFLTSFFLGYDMLNPSKKGDLYGSRVAASVKKQWVSYAKYKRPENHKEPWMTSDGRGVEQYFCRLQNTETEETYTVAAEIMPNKGTPDAGANRRLHIMRCPMRGIDFAYATLRNSNSSISVELLRGNEFLMKFGVPWKTRKVGYSLSSPSSASKLDAWKGADEVIRWNGSHDTPGNNSRSGRDRLHMCVPGLESHPDKNSIPLYLEFIQHHLLLGVDHIHISTVFAWGSLPMDRLLLLLASFINDGSVSVSSQAGDDIDDVYSTSGFSWFRDNSKIFYVNMCFYHAKGNADYVGIWDFDEFFIPKPPHNSILDVIQSMEGSGKYPEFPKHIGQIDPVTAQRNWKGGPGFADGHMHPFCYIMLSSEVVCSDNSDGGVFDYSKPWIGQRFRHGVEPPGGDLTMAFKKSIVPTDRIFQVGLHMHGACAVPFPWNGCPSKNEPCYSRSTPEKMGVTYTSNGTLVDFSFTQSIDGTVWNGDTKKVDTQTQGVIYHFQVHRSYLDASPQSLKGDINDYAKYFFPRVILKLKERGYVLLENFPEDFGSKVLYDLPAVHYPWKPIFKEFLQKMRVRELFP